jgi:hypothetical protein
MTKRNRDTLKKRFGDGAMPSTGDFGDLIDSTLNIQEDGILHNQQDGLRLTQVGDAARVLSFYGAIAEQSAIWGFSLDPTGQRLTLDGGRHAGGAGAADPGDGGGSAVLTLIGPRAADAAAGTAAVDPRVGINNPQPRCALDVAGAVAAHGRTGRRGTLPAPADGEWHTISAGHTGCSALEVMAGAGRVGEGKYALMHAFALRTFNAKGDFTYHQAHYDTRRHRMELRWLDDPQASAVYTLQIRVNCPYGAGTMIRYAITELWFDPAMDGSRPEAGPGAPA